MEWLKPSVGTPKLNVDRVEKGNPRIGGRGGIIRDHKGDMVVAFHNFFG